MSAHRRLRVTAPAAAALLALVGCGVPTGGPPSVVPASEVPFGLTTPGPSHSPQATVLPDADRPEVYLLADGDRLVAQARELPAGTVDRRLQALLDDLTAGPFQAELDQGLSTALPPGADLVAAVRDATATIDLSGTAGVPIGRESRLAVAQIVLTATSLGAVRSVRLTVDGEPAAAPLPSGELTDAPLTADDYRAAVAQSPAS